MHQPNPIIKQLNFTAVTCLLGSKYYKCLLKQLRS